MSAFQMELNDYPHFNLTEDGTQCSKDQHYPWFLRVLCDALIRLGYDGDAPVYRCRLSTAHSMGQYEVSGSEPDTGIELMVNIALTSLCEDHLAATAARPIALLPIQD
jgi:hypothetical protein